MPQLDVEKLVCVGDRKVTCETLVDATCGGDRRWNPPPAAVNPDILAESSEREIGWADRNAVYDRNDSTTGSTNPKSSNTTRRGPAASNNSQLFSTNLKAKHPIIGLPGKIQPSGFDGRNARRPSRVPILPKKARRAEGGGRGKSAVPESEPGSPKVSCFGKVLSDKERERRRREGQRAAEGEWKGWGCSVGFAAIFRCSGGGQRAEKEVERKITAPPGNIPAHARNVPEPPADAPALGEMKRFVSGRRAASWGAEAVAEAGAGQKTDRLGVWGRRSVGSVGDGE